MTNNTVMAVTVWHAGHEVVDALRGRRDLVGFTTDYRGPLLVVLAACGEFDADVGTAAALIELTGCRPADGLPAGACAWDFKRVADVAPRSVPTGGGIYPVAGETTETTVVEKGAA